MARTPSICLRRLRGAVVVTVLSALLFTASPPLVAAASDNGEWSLRPAALDGAPRARTFFEHEVAPGRAVQDRATLANLTDHPLTFDLYAADGYTTADGGFALRLQGDARRGLGAWVSLTTPTVTVAPKSSVTFPLQVGVPSDAAPGDWAGGIVASVARPVTAGEGPAGLVVEQGVAARIYVRVSGPLKPAISVNELHLDLPAISWAPIGDRDRGTVSYLLANTGNTRLSGTAQLEITDSLGRTVRTFPNYAFTDLLPDEELEVSETWDGMPLRDGRYRARVVARSDRTSVESWSPVAWHVPVPVVVMGLLALGLVLKGVRASRWAVGSVHRLRVKPVGP